LELILRVRDMKGEEQAKAEVWADAWAEPAASS
jgi:hypothetical protein